MTASERHREGVFARWGSECYARAHGDCSGRVQAAHWISKQGLQIKQSQIRLAIRGLQINRDVAIKESHRLLADMPLDGLIADPRNGVPLCSHHHDSFDRRNGQALDLKPPEEVREFAAEYGLEDWI